MKVLKIILAVIILIVLGISFIIASKYDSNFAVFLTESMIDNAVFCIFFLIILWITGVSC